MNHVFALLSTEDGAVYGIECGEAGQAEVTFSDGTPILNPPATPYGIIGGKVDGS
jgi:hypothetical protein